MRKEEIKSIYGFLSDKGQIRENNVIDCDLLRSLFHEKDKNSWEYLSPLIELKNLIEQEGLACQTRNGSLVIFDVNRNHEIGQKRIKKSFRIQDKTGKMLLNTNINKIDDQKAKKEHMHLINVYLFLKKGRVSIEHT